MMNLNTATENLDAATSNALSATLTTLTIDPAAASPILWDRDQVVLDHMPMVRFIARKIHERLPQHVELDELVSAGLVGLVDAVGKFDATKQVQFKSYAQFRVRGAILDSLRSLDWSPRELRRKGRAITEATQLLTARLGRVPSQAEIADELALDLSVLQNILSEIKSLEIGSLHAEHTDDSGDEELAFVPAPVADDPLFRLLEGEKRDRLIAAIDTLPEKERLVLTLYYYEELTMKEIGLVLGVVESRVSQIRSCAVTRLRRQLGLSRSGNRLTRGRAPRAN